MFFLFICEPRHKFNRPYSRLRGNDKGIKWLIPYSLTTPAASRHPSNGGELGTFPSQPKIPFTTDGAADFHTVAEQSSPLRRGAAIPGPAKMQFSWVVSVPGWFNAPPPKSEKNHNNSSRRSYECPPPPGPARRVAWVKSGRGCGMSPEALAKGKTRVTKTPHRGVFYSASSSDNASPSSDSAAAMLSGVAGIKSACACNLTIARTISIARCNW